MGEMEFAARPHAVKRFFKFLGLFALVLFGLALALGIFVRVKYPPAAVRQILLDTLARQYGITAACERLTFSLFRGFVAEKIKLIEIRGQRTDIPAHFRSPLDIENLSFSYHWRSLLTRRLEIDEIVISQPVLRYWQFPDATTNLDAWLAAFADTVSAAAESSRRSDPV